MSNLSRLLLGICACISFSSFAEKTCFDDIKQYRLSLRHIESGGVGYNQGYTTLEVYLAPQAHEFSISPFIDLRGHVFDNGKFAANAGIGIRGIIGERVYGGNAYYDYRNTKRQHYNQIGLGFETLGVMWDFRANAYLPVGPKKSVLYDTNTTVSAPTFRTFLGHQALVRQSFTTRGKVEYAMTGINAEVAVHILKNEDIDLYAAAGPYYYNYSSENAFGGQVRLGAKIYEYLSLEVINSYDSRFHENFQGSVGINIPFGPKSKSSKIKKFGKSSSSCLLAKRLVQDVERQEIIVVDTKCETKVSQVTSSAINPLTGSPYFFVFVDNTSSSEGTYVSPYPTLALAQENSNPGDIIYVFPGDGTTTGMDSGIALQANQKFWGSGIDHSIPATLGTFTIPAQSSSSPTITNTDISTDGNVISLASNNAISGFNITAALNDAIFGADPRSLEVSFCTIETSSTYAIEATFSGDASVTLTNNQFLDNTNGISLILHGTSDIVCSDNTFTGQTSVSNAPLEISSDNNTLTATIENNVMNGNTTGGIRMNLDSVLDVTINVVDNTITNNGTGSVGSLGSSFVILPNGTINDCSILMDGNTFSGNTSNALYSHGSGEFTTLNISASANTISDNGGSGLVLATPADNLTLLATENVIMTCSDNGIAIIASGTTTNGNITINNNSITDIRNTSSGIALVQDFTDLFLTVSNNIINECEGSGIISYAPSGISSLTLDISNNTITHCQNLSSNAAAGIDIEQFTSFEGSITNNSLSGNTGIDVMVGSTLPAPTACLSLTENESSNGYTLSNPGDGTFLLSPCDVDTSNTGTINTSGVIDRVQSCSNPTPCPP